MILFYAFLLALVWGLVGGGQLSRLQSFSVRGYGLALAAFVMQVVTIYLPLPDVGNNLIRIALLFITYVMLAVFLWWNLRLPGMWLIALGFVANWVVILANGGHMPITYEAVVAAGLGRAVANADAGTLVFGSKDILLPFEQTQLGFLSDIFVIPPPFPIPSVFSMGDFLIALGMFWLVPGALGARTGAPIRTHS